MPNPAKVLASALRTLGKLGGFGGGGAGGWDVDINGTRRMARAIESELDGWSEFSDSAVVGASAGYAIYVELGTSTQPPQPALRPAVEETMADVDRLARKADSADELINLIALEIESKYKDDVPVDTGYLRNSIYVERI